MLVAATNPCPCGYAGDGERCGCGEADMARHRRRLNGPLLDRIDLQVDLQQREPNCGAAAGGAGQLRTQAREQVAHARERQAARLAPDGVSVNAHMSASMLRATCPARRAASEELLSAARRVGC